MSDRLDLRSRQVPRLKKKLPFVLEDGWRGEVVDLSAAGLRIECLAVLAPLSTVEGTLTHEGKPLKVRAVVIWAEPPDHASFLPAEVGLELLDTSTEYLALVATLFAEDDA